MTTVLNGNSMISTITAYTPYDVNPDFPIFDGNNRMERAMAIYQTPRTIKKVAKGKYTVKSQFSYGMYVVDMNGEKPTCTCPDFQKNGQTCKHIEAVKMKLGAGKDKWDNYNLAQITENANFATYLKELVSTVEEPEQKTGRPSIPLSEQIFFAVMKVYSNKSCRRCYEGICQTMEEEEMDVRHFNTPYKLLQREDITEKLYKLVRLSAAPMSGIEHEFAIDSSGFRTSKFEDWCDTKHGRKLIIKGKEERIARREHEWLKCHISSGVKSNIIADVIITESKGENTNDNPNFRPLLDETTGYFKVTRVFADAGYLSKENFAEAERLGIEPYIWFKRNSKLVSKCPAWNTAFRKMFDKPQEWKSTYFKRNNVESTFGALKMKFGETLKSRNHRAQINELLCKIIAYNITVVHKAVMFDAI